MQSILGGASPLSSPPTAPGLELLLDGLQSPINIGMILRVAETFGFSVAILDYHHVLAHADKRQTIEDFACGAVARRGYTLLADEGALARRRTGRRLIATSIETNATPLPLHRFSARDIIVLGNEYDGVSPRLSAAADVRLRIPMPDLWTPKPKARRPIDPLRVAPVARDGSPSLNVAMAAAIICYAAYAGSPPARHQREDGAASDIHQPQDAERTL